MAKIQGKKSGKMRGGFTLVELLFVMAIIAILAGIAFANLSGSNNAAKLVSMKADARSAIAAEQAYYADNQEFSAITSTSYEDSEDGLVKEDNGFKTNISKGNRIGGAIVDCDDGGQGFSISVWRADLNKRVKFNSCSDASIKVVAPSSN